MNTIDTKSLFSSFWKSYDWYKSSSSLVLRQPIQSSLETKTLGIENESKSGWLIAANRFGSTMTSQTDQSNDNIELASDDLKGLHKCCHALHLKLTSKPLSLYDRFKCMSPVWIQHRVKNTMDAKEYETQKISVKVLANIFL